jgi:predicted N-acyltransferase
MKLTARVTRKIEDIPQEDWAKVFPDVLESYNFFKSLDESKLEQFSFYYIMVYDGDTAVGAVPCFSMRYSLDTSINGPLRNVLNRVKKSVPNILSVKALICGMPMGQGNLGLSGNKAEVFKAILRKMDEVAKSEKISILAFKDFPVSYNPILDLLTGEKFTKVDSLPYAEMGLDFRTFDDYLKKLSGATRYDLKRKFKKVDGAVKIEMKLADNLTDELFAEMYGLYMQIVEKHEMGFEIVPIDFFKNMAKNMPKQTKFFLWRIDGKLAAFLFALASDGVFIDYYLGLNYEFAHEYHLFFIKFRDVMKWCIENNIKKYEMGISGYEAKKRLGFDFALLHIYVKHRNRFLNPIFKILCGFLKFENFDPDLKKVKRSMIEKRRSNAESIRPDNPKRPDGQCSPTMHEEGAIRDRD